MSEPNFQTYLASVPLVYARVGTRIFPDMVRQGTDMPAIAYSKTGVARQKTYCGTHGLVLGTFSVDMYGKTRAQVRELSELVFDALIDYRGPMGSCVVKDCSLSTDYDNVASDPGLLMRTQIWDVWYVERD